MEDVCVATFESAAEAEMWAELLQAEGIPTVLVPLGPGASWGAPAWLPHELRVRAGDAARARELLAAAED